MRGQPRILGCVQQLLDEQQALERSAGECGAEEQGRLVQQIEHLQERHVTPPGRPGAAVRAGGQHGSPAARTWSLLQPPFAGA